ncbi:hypothetical protein RhiirA1_470323 [Rhizophagus irregularis]|uniref:Uncharacterized protein n=1 Tax=Rhizophagus irregularis TaxID=588596 RepID=A0A2N0R5I9_9GLOM|nr:hypothetical protein RhiirA1_470792 [Rhizophagus irregularis]PKC58869.1 hypothetical protein RhiirA1_470323 [Rhizophagus irregularis]
MFIENEVNIHTLVIEILNVPNYDSYQNDMFEIILRNRNFINNNVGSGNCSNTLNTIILYKVNFNVVFTRQIVNLNKPFKLKSLFIDERSQIDESIKLLLQKSGDYLENIGYKFCRSLSLSEQQILNNIIIYCKNIKFLDLYEFKEQINYLSIDLIKNIKQNLKIIFLLMQKNY